MNEIKLKDVRGFTLVELLAVIVVLAIVMLIGLTAVVPLMNSARAQSFAIEANGAIESAQTYWMANMLESGSDSLPTNADVVKCIDIQDLIDYGNSDLTTDYTGYVLVKRKSQDSSVYLYVVSLNNGQLQVVNAGSDGDYNVDITSDMVYDSSTSFASNYSSCDAYLASTGGNSYVWPTSYAQAS